MHEAVPRGYLLLDGQPPTAKQLAAITGASLRELATLLAELRQARVYSIDPEGWLYSRRMVKDTSASMRGQETGKRGGNPKLLQGTVDKEDRERRFSRKDHPSRVRRVFEKSGGRCHWCDAPLVWDAFHVDHVAAIRDGGGNEEANLVAACPDCNGKRAVGLTPTTTVKDNPLRNQTVNPDHNPQETEPEAEERKEVTIKTAFFSGTAARAERLPDALEAALAEAGVTPPEPNPVGAEVVQMEVRRTKKALEMRIPYGEVRSVDAQLDALKAQPGAVGAEATMGLAWRPADPVRTPAQQYAELTGCSLEEAEAKFGNVAAYA
jgi:5-methylcytosine-specific restriction endonuclease McrA